MSEPRYKNAEGQIGVLISPQFGAGWSTWNGDHQEFALFNVDLVKMALDGCSEEEVTTYIEKVRPGAYFYPGGWSHIKVVWVAPGTLFWIKEYDGSESIVFAHEKALIA